MFGQVSVNNDLKSSIMSFRNVCFSIAFGSLMAMGCGGESNAVISPPEGAREMTPEEMEEFNKNAAGDMEPVIRD
ncbi:hypothetical protein LF1_47380 [Rubripirellula obstinata]|uniref:Uncharacterized protein n=2 Tax=Rubripirellula obstinata TaxID=406547 RepID=A0A5B1CNR4_9BACT|nr:hypothetical protein LF1_47380 [Rubripirellula obstinata]